MSSDDEKAKARERARASYYANRERYLERGRAWRAANKGWMKDYNAAYHAANKERENARSQAYKEANRGPMNERRRATYAVNIDQERAYQRNRKKTKYALNPQKYRDLARRDRLKPGAKAREAAYKQEWVECNRDRVKVIARRWYQRNLDHARLKLAISTSFRRRRNVPWANEEAIAVFYFEAALLTRVTGRTHVVDHIIPLQGRAVSGLHVETNLRVVERSDNARKSNKWESPGWLRPTELPSNVWLPPQLPLF